MHEPNCPECDNNSGVMIRDGMWFCGDCNFYIENEDEGMDAPEYNVYRALGMEEGL